MPVISTLWNTFERLNYSTKTLTPVSSRIDLEKQIEHLNSIQQIPWRDLVNCDETHNGGAGKHQSRRGRTKKGKKAHRKDFIINDKHFTIMAAYTPKGFLCWKFFHFNCNQFHFINILDIFVTKFIQPQHCMMYDNASIHCTNVYLSIHLDSHQ